MLRKLNVNKIVLAAVIACASLISSTANAQQKCLSVGGSFKNSCKDIQVTGPGCASRSSTTWIYGHEVKAACKDNSGQYVQRAPYPISTNNGSGGGAPKIQTQTCRELGNSNGFLTCTKR